MLSKRLFEDLHRYSFSLISALLFCLVVTGATAQTVTVTGEQKRWHPITITLDGPQASESGSPNPFLDYRFEVVFSLAEVSITVPGYFAADGNAAETSATSGNKWRAHFVPPLAGSWTFRTSFRQGTDVALSTDPNAGNPVDQYNDIFNSLNVAETDKGTDDFRGRGILRYTGEHYLQYDNGDYFIKGGADSPENFLAYEEFDGTYNNGGTNFIKSYSDHVQDWNEGDPSWQNGKGKGIIGALNYLASEGMNSVYFITMNINGDGQDVWPYTSPGERVRFDVSKLDQWNMVFDHMDANNIMLHVLTQETENELLLDGGNLGRQRKAYFRELVARFSYHAALTWNLGEENDENTDAQRKAFADYIRDLDPYDHPIVLHTFPGRWNSVYTPLLGYPSFEGPSLQVGKPEDTHSVTLDWVTKSAANGRKWYVCMDEAGPWQDGVTPDGNQANHDTNRKEVLWGNLMAGGGGVEWYFGFQHPENDVNAEDWRSRDAFWDYTRHALHFFHTYLPFHEMTSQDNLSSNANSYVYAKPNEVYAVYLKNGGTTNLNLSGSNKTYTVKWFNPRTGGSLLNGSVSEVTGSGTVSIGNPPSQQSQDWVALLEEKVNVSFGDVTSDGQISALDASLILQHTIGLIVLPGNLTSIADVSGNNNISAFDGAMVLQYVVSLINCFPADPACSGKRAPTQRNSPALTWSTEHTTTGAVLTLGLSEDEEPFNAVDLSLVIDNVQLAMNQFEHSFPDDWYVSFNETANGLKIAAAGLTPASAKSLIKLKVTSTGELSQRSPVEAYLSVDESPVTSAFAPQLSDSPTTYALSSNYPNPFNPETTITYSIANENRVLLEVFDLTGRSVATLVDAFQPAGQYTVRFDASTLPSGVYLYRIEAGNFQQINKMTLLR